MEDYSLISDELESQIFSEVVISYAERQRALEAKRKVIEKINNMPEVRTVEWIPISPDDDIQVMVLEISIKIPKSDE